MLRAFAVPKVTAGAKVALAADSAAVNATNVRSSGAAAAFP